MLKILKKKKYYFASKNNVLNYMQFNAQSFYCLLIPQIRSTYSLMPQLLKIEKQCFMLSVASLVVCMLPPTIWYEIQMCKASISKSNNKHGICRSNCKK